jgi:5'-methylthioadenosine phosphorylase
VSDDSPTTVGVFGGSGFYKFLDDVEEVAIATPYGPPSARIRVGEIEGTPVAFMPRHGDHHELPPHRINYRANVWAMREVGATRIIGPCACGSLQPELQPGTFVVADQFVDRTRGRPRTWRPRSRIATTSGPFSWRRPASWTFRWWRAARWW